MRWALDQGVAVIPKSVRPDRIKEWAEEALMGGWHLSRLDMDELATLEDGHKYCWDPKGVI